MGHHAILRQTYYIYRWTTRQWKHVKCQTIPHFNFYCKNRRCVLLLLEGAKATICVGIGVHQCPQHGWLAYVWSYHWRRGVYWDFRDICCHHGNIFSQEDSGYESRTAPSLILHVLQQGHRVDTVHKLDWPDCSLDISETENVSQKVQSDNGNHGLMSSLCPAILSKYCTFKSATISSQ